MIERATGSKQHNSKMKIAASCTGILTKLKSVRVTSASFYAHLLALASAPSRKVTRFGPRRRRRDPTPQELAGLQRANEQRAKEARKRREAKAAAAAPAE